MEKALLHDVAQYYKFDVMNAELEYQMYLSGTLGKPCPPPSTARAEHTTKESSPKSNLAKEIEKAREKIKSLNTSSPVVTGGDASLLDEVLRDNKELRSMVETLTVRVKQLEETVSKLSLGGSGEGATKPTPAEAKPTENGDDGEDDDDFDLFGDDDEEEEEVDAEKEREKEERLKAYHDKKSKKPTVVAKSNIILDVKPWDDETDMGDLERSVRSVEMDGLLWGTAKLVPVGYGIKKLQISCVVEDEKVSVDDLEEQITSFEDYIQSVDIVAFNKI